ncbi:MAG: hypothetical protein IE889_07710 [Campylobacterales bacterium]|nr:hypothetical protein [Campylobacterales bacterium]
MKKTLKQLTIIGLSVISTPYLIADEVTDILEESITAYKEGDYVQVKENLTYVLELLKQKKGESLKTILPEALNGWQAEEATSETAGAGMLGGGTNVSRVYKKDKSEITVSIVTDSPLMQSIGMMMSNPMFASGGKLTRINREKAMVKYETDRKSGELTLVYENQYLISVKGDEVTEEELVEYAKAIDLKKLKEL